MKKLRCVPDVVIILLLLLFVDYSFSYSLLKMSLFVRLPIIIVSQTCVFII